MALHEGLQSEAAPNKEKFAFNCKAIIVCGHPGSGQTSAAQKLGESLNIGVASIGTALREMAEAAGQVGFIQRGRQVDKELDLWQKQLLAKATRRKPVLLDAKLGAINALELKRIGQLKDGDEVSFFITCPADIRGGRIHDDPKRNPDNLSRTEIMRQTHDREQQEIARWRNLHNILKYINPYNPNAKDRRGRRVYDYVVSSANKSAEEVAQEMKRILVENGHIRVVNGDSPKFPSHGTIFNAA